MKVPFKCGFSHVRARRISWFLVNESFSITLVSLGGEFDSWLVFLTSFSRTIGGARNCPNYWNAYSGGAKIVLARTTRARTILNQSRLGFLLPLLTPIFCCPTPTNELSDALRMSLMNMGHRASFYVAMRLPRELKQVGVCTVLYL